jgi:uncharacterized repeat protein (TIGR04076 family)
MADNDKTGVDLGAAEFGEDDLSFIFDTANKYYQEVRVTKVEGECPYGHNVGDTFRVTARNHDGLCGSLYQLINGDVLTLGYGGEIPWAREKGIMKASCPEGNKVQVAVRRVKQQKPISLKTRTDTREMTGKGYPALDKYRIYLEVLGIENICMWEHKIDERFEIDPFNVGKCCGMLYKVAYPFVNLLLSDGKLPWEGEEHIIHSVCPDPYDLLTFRLIREKR